MAEELGFLGRFENSLDAVSDRDFVAEALFDLALLGVHLSRMGEEIVLWSTEEFGFCVLDDAYATGSSMLPQKKNPDVAELARGKAGRLIGHLTGLLVTLKGLPLAYNRDLQEDKEPLFDSVAPGRGWRCARWRACSAPSTWHQDRMQAAADGPAAAAVDLAELLVERGMPFRQAHALVGGPGARLARAPRPAGRAGPGPSRPRRRRGGPALEPGVAVTRRTTPGGAGSAARWPSRLERFGRRLDVDRARLAGRLPARSAGLSADGSTSRGGTDVGAACRSCASAARRGTPLEVAPLPR